MAAVGAETHEPAVDAILSNGAIQAWAQAAAAAGSLELQAMIASLRQHQFDTVLGRIGFDEKGDVTLQSPVLYEWHAKGQHVLEQGVAKQ